MKSKWVLILFFKIMTITSYIVVRKPIIFEDRGVTRHPQLLMFLSEGKVRKEGITPISFADRLVKSFVINQSEISFGIGITGFLLLLLNRSIVWNSLGSSPHFDPFSIVSDVRSRADIIAAVACSGLLLNLFSDNSEDNEINRQLIDNRMREREKVALVGYYFSKPFFNERLAVTKRQKDITDWLYEAIRSNIPVVTSVHLVNRSGRIVAAAGVIDPNETKRFMSEQSFDFAKAHSILGGVVSSGDEVYLPDLQILPAKIEFSYLPLNCQSVLIISLSKSEEIVVFGTNQAKALKFDDLQKLRTLSRLCDNLKETEVR